MADQAGTVIGGLVLSMRAWAPRAISPESVGSCSRQRSNTRAGAAESRPTTSSFENVMLTRGGPHCIGDRIGPQIYVAYSAPRGGATGPARQAAQIRAPHQDGVTHAVPRLAHE